MPHVSTDALSHCFQSESAFGSPRNYLILWGGSPFWMTAPEEAQEKDMRPHPQAIRLNHDELVLVDTAVTMMTERTGQAWNRHRVLKMCSLAGLDVLLEREPNTGGGGDTA